MNQYYFNAIELVPAHYLDHCVPAFDSKVVRIDEYMPWVKVPTVGLVDVEETESVDKGQTIFEIKIKSKIRRPLSIGHEKMAVRLTSIDGYHYLVGWWQPPYPLITTYKNYPSAASDGAGCFLSITLKSEIPMLFVVES